MKDDRCGICAFADPTPLPHKIVCVVGGNVSGPYDAGRRACLVFRPNKLEARRRDPELRARAKAAVDIASKQAFRTKHKTMLEEFPWSKDQDDRLRLLFETTSTSVAEIADMLGIKQVHVLRRINNLRLHRKADQQDASTTTEPEAQPVNIREHKFPRLRGCNGQCCKHKFNCRRYYRWLELGKPEHNVVNSISGCINCVRGSHYKDNSTTQTFREYIGLDGSTHPDSFYYSDSPKQL